MNYAELQPGRTYYLPVRVLYVMPEAQARIVDRDASSRLRERPAAEDEPVSFPPRVRLWDGREVWLSEDVWQHLQDLTPPQP